MSKQSQMENTLRKCFIGGGIVGVSAGVGGLVAGPVGLAVGGVVGGAVASATVSSFRSAPDIMANDPQECQSLLKRGMRMLEEIKTYLIENLLFFIKELPNCKTWEDLKKRVLYPLLEQLIAIGAKELVRIVWKILFSAGV